MAAEPFKWHWEQQKKWIVALSSFTGVNKDQEFKFESGKLILDPLGTRTTWGTVGTKDPAEDTTAVSRIEGMETKIYILRRRVCLLCKAPGGSGGIVWVAEEGG